MKIRITFVAEIDEQEMIEDGVDIYDKDQVFDYYSEQGGETSFHSYGEAFEIIEWS